jgi:hypothetical protein
VRDFLDDDHVFDPGTVSILMAAFDGAWQSIKASGARLSEEANSCGQPLPSTSLHRPRRGEFDQVRLRDGALQHLAHSNLRRASPQIPRERPTKHY